MAFRGPLPRYFSATQAELTNDRMNLPGVSHDETHRQDMLAAHEVIDIHIPLTIAEAVVKTASPTGGRVLDPFAGYGTTLVACEAQGRHGVGVELLPEHVRICQERAPRSTIIEGDSRGLHRLVDGAFDLCFTAPPFLTRNDHPTDPLSAYERDGGDYGTYLNSLANIIRQVSQVLKPGGFLVMNVANIRYRNITTRLAWDVAEVVDPIIPFVSESVLIWDELPHDFTSDYLLCFQHPG